MLDRLDAAGGALGGLLVAETSEKARHLGRVFGGEHRLGGAGLATVPVVAHRCYTEATEQVAHAVGDLAIVFTHGVLLREALRVETVEVHTQLPLDLQLREDLGEHERERLRGLLREPIGLGGVGPPETCTKFLVHVLVVVIRVVVAEPLAEELLRVLRTESLCVGGAQRVLAQLLDQRPDQGRLDGLVLRRGLLVLVEALEHTDSDGSCVREPPVVGLHELVAEDEEVGRVGLIPTEGRDHLEGFTVLDGACSLGLGDRDDLLLPTEADELVGAVLQVVDGLRGEDGTEVDLVAHVFSPCAGGNRCPRVVVWESAWATTPLWMTLCANSL